METKEMKIVVPKGYEIDEENSTFKCIKFKPLENVAQSYEDVAQSLFKGKTYYFINVNGYILRTSNFVDITDGNNATSKKQLKKLLAINKLMNVAKYLNGNWKPCWSNNSGSKWYIYVDENHKIGITWVEVSHTMQIYFKTKELAKQAISILGEDTIYLASSTDW